MVFGKGSPILPLDKALEKISMRLYTAMVYLSSDTAPINFVSSPLVMPRIEKYML